MSDDRPTTATPLYPLTPVVEHWTLDRRIPLAMIIALAMQAITFSGVGAVGYYRLGDIGDRVKVLEVQDRIQEREASERATSQRIVIAELSAAMRSLRETVVDLRDTLRTIEARRAPPSPYQQPNH